jgi:LacI family transcriptional regulator
MTTQKDIAEKLGVSVALVSRALSGKAEAIGVAAATVRRIHAEAERRGYIPNASARLLRGGPSRTLGVIVFDFADPFFGPFIEELHRLAHTTGHSLVLIGVEHRRVEPRDLQPLLKHGVGGAIVLGSGGDAAGLAVLAARRLPVARIGHGPLGGMTLTTHVDERAGVAAVLAHLVQTRRMTVGFLGGIHPAQEERFEHFRAGLKPAGLTSKPAWQLFSAETLMQAGYAACRQLLAQSKRDLPAALVAGSDVVALGAMRALKEEGLSVPKDIAVTGFDDIPVAQLVAPTLTTVRQPIARMARLAFEAVTHPAAAPQPAHAICKPLLVVRESA